jgi:hypothetical protein
MVSPLSALAIAERGISFRVGPDALPGIYGDRRSRGARGKLATHAGRRCAQKETVRARARRRRCDYSWRPAVVVSENVSCNATVVGAISRQGFVAATCRAQR